MRVIVVKMFAAEKRMDVFVETPDMGILKIPFHWKTQTGVVPEGWYETVQNDIAHIRKQRGAKKTGGGIMGSRKWM